MPFPGMNNGASPLALRRGFAPTELLNIEHEPQGALSRRRGFQGYTAAAAGGALYNLYAYDRNDSGTRKITLVARKVAVGGTPSLVYKEIYNGTQETQTGSWQTMSSAPFSTAVDKGRFFARDEYLYFSEGTVARGFEQPADQFALGLATPTGTIKYTLDCTTDSRIEPGYYDWTVCAYESGRNVRSHALGFQTPGTLLIAGGGHSWVSYYSIAAVPDFDCTMRIGVADVELDEAADCWELYRRHPYTANKKPARRFDDARMVHRVPVSASNYNDKFGDTELGARLTYAGTTTPPWTTACQHGNYWWFVLPAEPYRLYRSESDAPENIAQAINVDGHRIEPLLMVESSQYGHTGEGWTPLPHEAGPVMQPLSFGADLLVLCANQTWMIAGTSWANYQRVCADEGIGCVSAASAIITPFGALWMSQEGVVWMPPGGRPSIVSEGFLDFDGATSPVRLNRGNLYKCCAAYDPDRAVAEFAVASYGAAGNDTVVALNLGQSTPNNPVFSYFKPQLGSGRFITTMCTVRLPTRAAFIVYGTDAGGYTYHRTGSRDWDTSAQQDIEWRIRGWVGADETRTLKTNLSPRLMPRCQYDATVSGAFWTRNTIQPPVVSSTPTDSVSWTVSETDAEPTTLAVAGDPFVYVSLSETSGSPFELHALDFFADERRGEPHVGKRIG